MSNKALWARAFKTDPAHVKAITGKDYDGNSPKPYYIVERLTDEFGPCGIGWGYTIDSERFERFSDTDVLHIAKVTLWYVMDGKRGEVAQMGQTKATYMTGQGKFKVDEDAPKKSVTDALVKCASYLGFAGDIFSGRWDDSKYVASLKREFSDAKKEMHSIGAVVDDDKAAELDEVALYMIDCHQNGKDMDAIRVYYELPDMEAKAYVWQQLKAESKLRAIVKSNSPHKEAA